MSINIKTQLKLKGYELLEISEVEFIDSSSIAIRGRLKDKEVERRFAWLIHSKSVKTIWILGALTMTSEKVKSENG